ncbi:variable surface lipoprotein [Mycoplasma sp. 4079]|uniref:variable surface lipoprotein n=1 Tax=Mycoplasma sp. 4079 TaxID=3398615 RepID=UPI0039FD39DF
MKKLNKKILVSFGTILSVSTLPLVSFSCGNSGTTSGGSGKSEDPKPSPSVPVNYTFAIDYNFNISRIADLKTSSSQLNSYETKLREFESQGSEVKKIKFNTQFNIGSFHLPQTPSSVTLTKDEYRELIKPILDDNNLLFLTNWELPLPIQITNEAEAKEFESEFQKFFNNFYATEQWFKRDFKTLTDAAKTSTFTNKLTLENATKGNKLTEYNAAVDKIKEFISQTANAQLSDDLKIIEIDPDYNINWALKLKFQTTSGIKTKNVRLDLKKADASWSSDEITERNANNQWSKKAKNKINEVLASSVVSSLLKALKIQFILNFNENDIESLTTKIVDMVIEYTFSTISSNFVIPRFVKSYVTNKLVSLISPIIKTKLLNFTNDIKVKLIEIARRHNN